MSKDFQTFLKSSIAKRVKLDSTVVLQKTQLSPMDVKGILHDKSYAVPGRERVCELEVDGISIARGKIVRNGRGCFFKVLELIGERS